MDTANSLIAECFVCRKHRGEIGMPGGMIYEDELIFASHVQIPEEESDVYLGYLMVEPKRHIAGLAELNDHEAQSVGLLIARLSRALKACEGAEHVYAFVMGDKVSHLHIHLVPRYPGAPRKYWGVHVDEWPQAPRGGPQEVEALCTRLRSHLNF